MQSGFRLHSTTTEKDAIDVVSREVRTQQQ